MHILEPNEGWDWFVRRTRRVPLLGGQGASVVCLPDEVMLSTSRGKRVLGLVLVLLLGVASITLGLWFVRVTGERPVWAAVGVGAFFVLIGMLGWCDRTGVQLDRLSGHVVLRRTFLLPTTLVELPTQGLKV